MGLTLKISFIVVGNRPGIAMAGETEPPIPVSVKIRDVYRVRRNCSRSYRVNPIHRVLQPVGIGRRMLGMVRLVTGLTLHFLVACSTVIHYGVGRVYRKVLIVMTGSAVQLGSITHVSDIAFWTVVCFANQIAGITGGFT